MNQLRQFVKGLSLRQRISIAGVALLAIAALYAFTHWTHERAFKPLYSELSSEDAASIVTKLKEGGIEYRFGSDNTTILVPTQRIPELRLQMAAAGIPKSGRIGYELFDKTNLGITDFTEQVNYHRAVEGELERSIMSMSEVDQARVHITFPKDSIFTENRQPAKASVMLKLKPGAKLSTQHAQAVSQLMASAVEGLAPEAVSVIDMQGNLLVRPKKPGDGSEPSEELLTWKKQLETEALAKINSVLDPLLGSEKYRASVDIDCDQTSGEQSEEMYDPTHSVITNSQRSEEGSISRDTAGVPGTQSNLPRPAMRPAVSGGGIARRTESMNYETSRTVRKIRLPQGIIRRMSVSVLMDQRVRWEPAKAKGETPKKVLEPPSADEVKVIHDVVAAASGFNQNRGDVLTVDSLPFEATLQAQPPAWMVQLPVQKPTAPAARWKRPELIGALGGLIMLIAAGGALVWRSRQKNRQALEALQKQLEAATAQAADSAEAKAEIPGDKMDQIPSGQELAGQQIAEMKEAYKLPPMITTKTEMLTKQVTEEARKDPAALAQIIRTWLNETS
jgi:flagellar M-ring protein FliF